MCRHEQMTLSDGSSEPHNSVYCTTSSQSELDAERTSMRSRNLSAVSR